MENLIKTEFTTSPMLTFDPLLDTSGVYYYHSSAESSPASMGFESSPDQSPSSLDFCQYSPSFESTLAPQQYFMSSGLEPNNQYQLYQSQESLQSYSSNAPLLAPSNGNVMMSGELIKPQQPSAFNELNKLLHLSEKNCGEDKLAIQAKIKQILFEHLNTKNQFDQSSSLITPPLSPNADNHLLFSGNKSPLFTHHVAQQQQMKSNQFGLPPMTHSMMKAEPQHTISHGQSQQQQQQQPIRRKLSPVYLGALDAASTGSNVINVDSGNLASQSPVSINSSNNVAQNSPTKMYFDSSNQQQQSISPVYGYKVESEAALPAMLINNVDSRSDSPVPVEVEPKKSKAKGSSKGKGQKGKGKVVSGELVQSGGMPKQSQKRSAHLSAEFRYRTKLNDKISKLRSLVGQKVHLSKSAVLTRSIERIVKLQKLTIRLHESNMRLQSLVAKYTANQQQQQQSGQMTNAPQLTTDSLNPTTKLMSIRELTRSLSVGKPSSPPSPIDQQMDMNKFLEQHSLMESEQQQQQTLDASNLIQNSDLPVEVFNLDQLLDQF